MAIINLTFLDQSADQYFFSKVVTIEKPKLHNANFIKNVFFSHH